MNIPNDFLKMFEHYFGHKWSKFLCGIIALGIGMAVFALTLHIFLQIYHGISYIYGNKSLYELLKDRAFSILLSIGLLFAFGIFIWEFIARIYKREMKTIQMKIIKETEEYGAKSLAEWRKEGEEVKALLAEVQKLLPPNS